LFEKKIRKNCLFHEDESIFFSKMDDQAIFPEDWQRCPQAAKNHHIKWVLFVRSDDSFFSDPILGYKIKEF